MNDITYKKAIEWIHNNTVGDDEGIIVYTSKPILYPEVTGYYIPSLLNAGETELAKKFAKKMCEIQKPDGSWYDSDDKNPFIFDSAQILKGLVAIRDVMPEVDSHIVKGIDWIFSNLREDGHLVQPNTDVWGGDDTVCNELIHIYCMSPILDAAKLLNRPDYAENANKVLDYYIAHYRDRIVNFTLFSHFYAYVIEGLVDCGRTELAREAMNNFDKYRKSNGAICAYNDVTWVCSTATFQFAIIWYKLGDKEKADKSYEYMCKLQNPSGGWYGSYTKPKIKELWLRFLSKFKLTRYLYGYKDEISWAVKFYLDAKYYKELSEEI